ncbi:MAG: mechanosensitive ion channel family protein [Anaerolineales bacterium]|jgi:miniconductance mechanosensitive channel
MDPNTFQAWVVANPILAFGLIVAISIVVFLFTRNIILRGLMNFASRSDTKIDDVFMKHLRPYRLAWLSPLLVVYAFAGWLPDFEVNIRKGALFLIIVVSVFSINALLSAFNEIYESRPTFNGVSIQSYLDIVKILVVVLAVILSISLFSGESPLVLLTGLGALTAVLLLIFQDTLLSIVASVQIVAQDLIKEGDWVEIPSYGADGDVVNISLHAIKVQNFDKTYTVVPTYKIVDVAYKNWRGMQQSGGRRIQRSLLIDMTSIKFCDQEMLERLCRVDLIQEELQKRMQAINSYREAHPEQNDSPLDGPQITNTEIFRSYIQAYLRSRTDIHQEGMPLLVRTLAPNPTGLPIELYIFTRTIDWYKYEGIQSEIIDHLLAAAWHFDLRVFQEPTGMDFSNFAQRISG